MDVTNFSRPALLQQPDRIIRAGRNVWQRAEAEQVGFLIDGEGYFRRLDAVLRQAQRSITILGWDFNPDIRLRPQDAASPTLGELLRQRVDSLPDLKIHILVWGMGPVYSGKSLKMFGTMDWSDHPRIDLRFDFSHPLRASHHQKVVVVDDRTAFVGGIDLTARRWDDRAHSPANPLRVSPGGEAYGPVHDMQMIVTGAIAGTIGDVARRRWKTAIGETLDPPPALDTLPAPWPQDLQPALTRCSAGLALTEPWKWRGRRGHREAIKLTHDALKAASRHLYIETQYLASFGVARTLARRLRRADGPEVVIIVTRQSHGFLERVMMGNNRTRLIRRLKRADRYDRLRVYYAVTGDGQGGEEEVLVHSKLIIADDRFVRVGSSNLNNRSEGLDTECDLAIESDEIDGRQAIAALRDDLIAEHLGTSADLVSTIVAETGSLIAAVERLNTGHRGLRAYEVDVAQGETDSIPGTAIVDPKQPFWPLPQIRAGFRRLLFRRSAQRVS